MPSHSVANDPPSPASENDESVYSAAPTLNTASGEKTATVINAAAINR